jgi:arylsulfatase A-like enzyme
VIWDKEIHEHPTYRDLGIDDHFTVDAAVRHLESLRDSPRPFLGVIHLNTNHYPYNTHEQYQRWHGTNLDLYDNTIVETDTHVGRIIDTLRDTGQLDHTVILFASDHGEAFNEHGYIAHFYCHFVETVSVPLWLYLPPGLVAQREMNALKHNLTKTVQNLDILPTVLDCIGAWDLPATEPLRRPLLGQSLLRPLTAERTLWITNTDEVMNSIIGLSSIKGSKHYMIRTSSIPAKEDLYDLARDPGEQNNLWPRCSAAERTGYRNGFLQFPIPSRIMREALRQADPTAPPPQ